MKMKIIGGLVVATAFVLANTAYAESATHWGYSGSKGPDSWGHLQKNYELCGKGKNQSPVNIKKTSVKVLDKIDFNYRETPIEVLNNGHTIQANYQPGSYMKIAGKRYELLQFHFHSPSEHQVKNNSLPLEMHFVHKSADGVLAVVGVLFEKGDSNKLLAPIWKNMPRKSNQTNNGSGNINASDFLPDDQAYYFYNGSLTTPPCSEGVKWFVMQNTNTVSNQQVKKFIKTVGQNARPVQAIHSRHIRQATLSGGLSGSSHVSSPSSHDNPISSAGDSHGGGH